MIFLGVVPLAVGAFAIYLVPLQTGAPDMAFRLNMASDRLMVYSIFALASSVHRLRPSHVPHRLGHGDERILPTTTLIISIPSVIAVASLVLSLNGGSIRFTTPMLFAPAFLPMFGIGGLTHRGLTPWWMLFLSCHVRVCCAPAGPVVGERLNLGILCAPPCHFLRARSRNAVYNVNCAGARGRHWLTRTRL